MKKSIIAVAFVAAVGLSAYLGFRPATESELSELHSPTHKLSQTMKVRALAISAIHPLITKKERQL